MIKKLKNILLYAGIDRFSYERIKPKIQKANLIMTTILSSFATVLITIMYITSFNSEGVKQNKTVYLAGLILSLVILLLSSTIARFHLGLTTFLVYLSYSIYYLYGILIGAVTDPHGKTVTFMVLLVFMPILFIDRPLHVIIVTIVYDCIFIILCYQNKEGAVLSVDLIDSVIFGILGLASGIVVNYMKVKGYTLEQKLHEISRIDQLTQIKNRNAYEVERDSIPDLCKYSLGCIYIDVNGLHELNNSKGHQNGDKMLIEIASEVKDAFSDDFSYRIGGDEFIAFIPDKSQADIDKAIFEMIDKIESMHYHIAVGYATSKTKHLSLDTLIKTAESNMFCNKKMYYKDIANREVRDKENTV